MSREILGQLFALGCDHHILAMHEILDGQAFAQRVIHTVEAALMYTGKIERRFAKDFAGDGAGVDAGAAEDVSAFNQSDAFAEVGRLSRALFAGRTRADHHKVIILHASPPGVLRAHCLEFAERFFAALWFMAAGRLPGAICQRSARERMPTGPANPGRAR